MKKLTKDRLNSAEDDLISIKMLLGNPILTNIVAFHSQQAMEKNRKTPKIRRQKVLETINQIIME